MNDTLVMIAVVLLAVGLVYGVIRAQRGLRDIVRRAAGLLGLSPDVFNGDEIGWDVSGAYAGAVEGAQVILATGQKLGGPAAARVPVVGVVAEIRAHAPADFTYRIGALQPGESPTMNLPDPEFNKFCPIVCGDPDKMLELLSHAEAREAMKQLMKRNAMSVVLHERGATLAIFNALQCRAEGVAERVREAVRLVALLRQLV